MVTWQAPEGTRHIACALFSCDPAFKRIGTSPTEQNELHKISNFEQCVLMFGAFSATQSTFPLRSDNAYRGVSSCLLTEIGPRVVNRLAVGCWAYDLTSIIAASDLIPVRGSLLPSFPLIPHDIACTADGDACYDAAADRFGVCLAGMSRAQCTTAVDCALADGTTSGSGACTWSCDAVLGHDLGACVPI